MELFKLNGLLKIVSPFQQIQRFRGKINIQRPRKPHFKRQLEIDFTKYIIPATKVDPIERCVEEKTKKLDDLLENPYERIIANEVRNWFDHSKMIGIFHMNSITREDLFKIQVPLHKSNMYIKSYGKRIIQMAFENSGYNALLPLFESRNMIVFSPEPQVSKLLKIVRKTPQLILLAGVIDGRLLHREDFMNYSKLPDLQTSRAGFAQLLLQAGSQITSRLNQHQSTLIQYLENRVKQLNELTDKEK